MLLQEKEEAVKELASLFKDSEASYLLNYQGATCQQLTDFRKELKPTGASFSVVKNTLVKRAIADSESSALEDQFSGPVAVVWAKGDVVSPAKIIAKHSKEVESLSVKAGVLEGKIIGKNEVDTLAELPSREELLSKLLSIMNAPATKVVQLLNAPASQLVRTIEAWRGELEKKG